MYSRDELSQFPLQKLASLYPATLQEEDLLKEMFDKRASVSSYFTLTSVVDVKHKWQEDILQKYIDEKRETMPPENPVTLTPEDEARLDMAVVTKATEMELQAKLDAENAKRKGIVEKTDMVKETEESEATPEPVEAVVAKKRGRPSKKDEAVGRTN